MSPLEKFYKYVGIVAPLGTAFLLAIIYVIFHFSDYPDYYESAIAVCLAVCILVFIFFSIKRCYERCYENNSTKMTLSKAINDVNEDKNNLNKIYNLAHFILLKELDDSKGKKEIDAIPNIILKYCENIKTRNNGHQIWIVNTIMSPDVVNAFLTYAYKNKIHEFDSALDDLNCFLNFLKGFFYFEKVDIVSSTNEVKLIKKAGCKCDQTSVVNMIDFIIGVFQDMINQNIFDKKTVNGIVSVFLNNDTFYEQRLTVLQMLKNKYYELGMNFKSISSLLY